MVMVITKIPMGMDPFILMVEVCIARTQTRLIKDCIIQNNTANEGGGAGFFALNHLLFLLVVPLRK